MSVQMTSVSSEIRNKKAFTSSELMDKVYRTVFCVIEWMKGFFVALLTCKWEGVFIFSDAKKGDGSVLVHLSGHT